MSQADLDPRLNAWRPDLASASLRGNVEAQRYAEGQPAQVRADVAPVRREPSPGAPLDTEALRGEIVTVYDERDGWAWIQLSRDRYVGYVRAESLSRDIKAVTHRVTALRTYVFSEPGIKSPPTALLSMNAGLTVTATRDKFLQLSGGGFVFSGHAAAQGDHGADFVTIAERFTGTPYLWGGRTSLGIDCSGLVQLAMEASGIACPRDSDMQEQSMGVALEDVSDLSLLRRGDLLFWPGHVAIAGEPHMLLHANAHHMETVCEPLAGAMARIAGTAGPIRTIRRLWAK